MSSHLHAQLFRARHTAATAAAGLILATAGVACAAVAGQPQASAANQAQSSIAPVTTTTSLHVDRTRRTFGARLHELEAQGYVQIECLVTGALMFNPHTHRTVIVRS